MLQTYAGTEIVPICIIGNEVTDSLYPFSLCEMANVDSAPAPVLRPVQAAGRWSECERQCGEDGFAAEQRHGSRKPG